MNLPDGVQISQLEYVAAGITRTRHGRRRPVIHDFLRATRRGVEGRTSRAMTGGIAGHEKYILVKITISKQYAIARQSLRCYIFACEPTS